MRDRLPHAHVHQPVCLSVCVWLSVFLSVCLTDCFSVCPSRFVSLSISLSSCLSVSFLCSSSSALFRSGTNKCCCCCLIPSIVSPLFTFQEKTRREQKTHRAIREREAEGLLIVYCVLDCRKGKYKCKSAHLSASQSAL